ncbi:MAG: TIGR00266 family protein [Bacillota bacterium]
MQYLIFGGNFPAVSFRLEQGESIYTQSGGMSWMTSGMQMETNMRGGLMKGLGRMLSGDSLFLANYTAMAPNQEITIASTFPGAILPIDVSQGEIIAQKSAFLCAQPGVTLSMHVVKGIGAGLFGGEGFILQRLSGQGLAFLEIDGSVCEKTLAPGEVLIVDTGNIAAYEARVQYEVTMIKGFKNVLFGGEGLLNTRLTGPGKVWLQTMTMPGFAGRIVPFLPKNS